MDELISRLVANVGVDRVQPRRPLPSCSNFSARRVRPTRCRPCSSGMPGAIELMEAQGGVDASGGGMFALGGIMGAGTKMMAAGLSMGQVQGVARETLAFAREKAGEDTVGEIVGAVPGLSQFV